MSEILENYYTIKNIIREEESEMKGDGYDMTPEKLAEKHNVSLEHINGQIKIGMVIEQEHVRKNTSKSFKDKIALKITLDHLTENSDYYTLLKEMESKFK